MELYQILSAKERRSLRVRWQIYPCVSFCVCVWKCTRRYVCAQTLVKGDYLLYLFLFSVPWRPFLDIGHKWNAIRSLTCPRLVNKIIAWFVVKKGNWKTGWAIFLPVPRRAYIRNPSDRKRRTKVINSRLQCSLLQWINWSRLADFPPSRSCGYWMCLSHFSSVLTAGNTPDSFLPSFKFIYDLRKLYHPWDS